MMPVGSLFWLYAGAGANSSIPFARTWTIRPLPAARRPLGQVALVVRLAFAMPTSATHGLSGASKPTAFSDWHWPALALCKLAVNLAVLWAGFRAISDDDYCRLGIAQRFA